MREDGISSNLFRSPRDVEGWESGFEMLPHRVPSGGNSPLSGFVEGFLNCVVVNPAKIGPELLKVNWLRCDGMFVLSNEGEGRGLGEGMLNSPLEIAKFIYPGVMGTALRRMWSPGGVTRGGRAGVVQNSRVLFMGTSE